MNFDRSLKESGSGSATMFVDEHGVSKRPQTPLVTNGKENRTSNGGKKRRQGRTSQDIRRPSISPISSTMTSSRQETISDQQRSESPHARPTPSNRATPICGNCFSASRRDCDGKARCGPCKDSGRVYCTYRRCALGSSCRWAACDRLHPDQWNAKEEGGGRHVRD